MGFEVFENYECEGQMSIFDMFPAPETVFAVSKVFARAKKQMTVNELKTFVYALTNIRWKEECPECIYLDKKTLAAVLGNNSDSNHLSNDLYQEIKNLPKTSFIEIADKDKDFYESGVIITSVGRLKNRFRIKLNRDYLSLFGNLENNYITMWSSDIFSLSTSRSIEFYEYLRLNTDTRHEINEGVMSVKLLKELFGIPKDGPGSYMREKGGFDRSNFEKYVINPLFEDLAKCKMIQPIKQSNGSYYEKDKRGNRIFGYRFYWTYTAYPGVATAQEVKQIQERVDKNPQILKVAKDILKGEKKPKKNSFQDCQKREYDFDALEAEILSRTIEVENEEDE